MAFPMSSAELNGHTIAPIMIVATDSVPPKPTSTTKVGSKMLPILMLCLNGKGP